MRSTRFLSALVFTAFLCACSPGGGGAYLSALADEIRAADRIVITEHSFRYDAYDANAGKSLVPDELVYKTVELSEQQKLKFLKAVESLDPTTQNAFPACMFEPHHTVRFYAGAKLLSTLEVCFQCGQVEWPGTRATAPWALYPGLAQVFTDFGLKPEQDWQGLAQARLPPSATSTQRP